MMDTITPALVVDVILTSTSVLAVLCSLFFLYITNQYKYWERRGIPGPKPKLIFGSMKGLFTLKNTEPEVINTYSCHYKDHKYYGVFNLWRPTIVVKDCELIKKVLVKDFEHFTDHPRAIGTSRADSIFDSLFTMNGTVWKSRRVVFSKLFTPFKLKDYAHDMRLVLRSLTDFIAEHVKKGKEFEMQAALETFVLYALTSALFGIDLRNDKDRTQKLIEASRFLLHPPPLNVLKFIAYSVHPKIMGFINFSTFPDHHWDETSTFEKEVGSTRTDGVDTRNDLYSICTQLRKEKVLSDGKISYNEYLGHINAFVQAGTHTTKTTLCHILRRLAENKDAQDKLRIDIDNVTKKERDITYDDLEHLPYLDYVIAEALRMDPLIGALKRVCTKDYKVDDKLTIPKGMDVTIDVYSLHYDPQYFPEPELYKPDRYTTGNADQAALLLFGKGPRQCIGQRFAKLQLKLVITSIISRYYLTPSPKMKYPLKFDPQTIFITNIPIGGIWINFKPREDVNIDL